MKRNKRVGVFDFDGTVVRSAAWSIDIFFRLLAEEGVLITRELHRETIMRWGMHFATLKADFFPQLSDETVYAIFDAMRPIVEIVPFRGTVSTVRMLRARGLDAYLLTSRPRLHTRKLLHSFGMSGLFTRAICSDDVGWENAKPSPYGIELIIEPLAHKVALAPEEVFYVGDGLMADRLCAAAAGVDFVAVNEERVVGRETWLEAGVLPENILPSIRDVPDWLGLS